MEIIMYQNLSDDNVLNKQLKEVARLNGTLQVTTSVTDPVIWVDNDVTQLQCNYAYIVDLERFYFIRSIQLVKNRIFSLIMECDVLMTFKPEILASTAHIVRQGDYNPYGTEFETEDRKEYSKVEFDYEFPEEPSIVLIAAKANTIMEDVRNTPLAYRA